MIIKDLIREYVLALVEMGPVAYDDTAGMTTPTRPTIDPDEVEPEFDHDSFVGLARRAYMTAQTRGKEPDIDELADEISTTKRKVSGVEIDKDDLESELKNIEYAEQEFSNSNPEEKVRYYADPKWYTKNS